VPSRPGLGGTLRQSIIRHDLPLTAGIVLWALITRPRLRSRATLTAGLAALAFLAAGAFAARRFFEVAASSS